IGGAIGAWRLLRVEVARSRKGDAVSLGSSQWTVSNDSAAAVLRRAVQFEESLDACRHLAATRHVGAGKRKPRRGLCDPRRGSSEQPTSCSADLFPTLSDLPAGPSSLSYRA